MYKKALFINYPDGEIPGSTLERLDKMIEELVFIDKDNDAFADHLVDADLLIPYAGVTIGKEEIDKASRLKFICLSFGMHTLIDSEYTRSKGIDVSNAAGYSDGAVAEWLLTALLVHIRYFKPALKMAEAGDFGYVQEDGFELEGKELAVVGAGHIGTRMAEIGIGLGMKVKYNSREKKADLDVLGAQYGAIDEIVKDADVVTVTLALVDGTEGIMSRNVIDLMKDGAVVACTSQLQLFDLDALHDAIEAGKITFVTDQFDSLSPEDLERFKKLDGCDGYPHMAYATKEAEERRWQIFLDCLEAFEKGAPINLVN